MKSLKCHVLHEHENKFVPRCACELLELQELHGRSLVPVQEKLLELQEFRGRSPVPAREKTKSEHQELPRRSPAPALQPAQREQHLELQELRGRKPVPAQRDRERKLHAVHVRTPVPARGLLFKHVQHWGIESQDKFVADACVPLRLPQRHSPQQEEWAASQRQVLRRRPGSSTVHLPLCWLSSVPVGRSASFAPPHPSRL